MPRVLFSLIALLAFLYSPWLIAQDTGHWLKQAMQAASRLNFAGNVLVQRGALHETVRIAHVYDGQQEIERLLTMDGQMREAIRVGDQITTYVPELKLVRVEPRAGRYVFPALAPSQVDALQKHFQLRLGGQERIAGHEAQVLILIPKDANRYTHVLWAELRTGLLLKTQILNEQNELLEQALFTDVQLGGRMHRGLVRPTFEALAIDWQYENVAVVPSNNQLTGWTASELPAGFVKIREGFRAMPGLPMPVVHLVYSDGLSSVSVFIEQSRAAEAQASKALAGQTFFRRQLNDFTITAVGETPFAAVQTIAMNIQAPTAGNQVTPPALTTPSHAAWTVTQAALNRLRAQEAQHNAQQNASRAHETANSLTTPQSRYHSLKPNKQ